MTKLFYEPDATKYPQEFFDQAIKCPGLEQLTGADFVISRLPGHPVTGEVASPVENLQAHIAGRSLFVQVKIGFDLLSFDNLYNSIARMQAAEIPKGQAILLPVGEYWNDGGELALMGSGTYGDNPYSTLGAIYDMWSRRGGMVEPLPPKNINELMVWIKRQIKADDKIEAEGTRYIYQKRGQPTFDIWQMMKEVRDWRHFLVAGIEGFGEKKAQAIFEYMAKHYPEQQFDFYLVLCVLTELNGKKQAHNVPGWGISSCKKLRGQLGIRDGCNLSDEIFEFAYWQGWQAFGKEMVRLTSKKKPMKATEAHKKLMESVPDKKEIEF